MINYSEFNVTVNHSLNLYNAIQFCARNNEDGIIFEKERYDFYSEFSFEEFVCVSNHDMFEMKHVGFLLKDFDNFIIDGNGSEFVFHNSMIGFVVSESSNITLRNLSIDYDETMMLDCRVIYDGKKYYDLEILNNDKYYISDGDLYLCDDGGHDEKANFICLRSKGADLEFIAESCDIPEISHMSFEDIGERKIRIHTSAGEFFYNARIIIKNLLRHSCAVFINNSRNVDIENVNIYRSYGMGIIAQKTENISLDHIVVKAKNDRLFSLSADATHFVHCKGLVSVINSSFSEQQDDALNIHGIYTKIVDKTNEYIIVKYMHHSAKGLNIYDKESEFFVLNPKTQLPYMKCKIKDVEIINLNYTKLYLYEKTYNIQVGDIIEDLTWSSDLVFKNNKVFNNRARGMLIAAKGNVEITDNYFNTPGVAILFESDGQYWFESGGTNNVVISHNVFENCKFVKSDWGKSVIETVPRDEYEKNRFYHKSISIENNIFKDCENNLIYLDNVENVSVKNNNLINCVSQSPFKYENCKKISD